MDRANRRLDQQESTGLLHTGYALRRRAWGRRSRLHRECTLWNLLRLSSQVGKEPVGCQRLRS